MKLRRMRKKDWPEVAALIHDSTNAWYEARGLGKIFAAGPESTRLFCEVYEALDPGCCVVAVDPDSGKTAGSCFFHPRKTHLSLGIMNSHPRWAGRGVASKLLRHVIAEAESRGLPLRLVSSAFNLDSYSLYTRHGFVPRAIYQDLLVTVPAAGFAVPQARRMRDARLDDVPAIARLERELSGIRRENDHRFFIENRSGLWHASVFVGPRGRIDGFLASIAHPASRMLGPGFARTEAQAFALIARELDHRRGQTMVLLAPADRQQLIRSCHDLGARNCELHFAQCRGRWHAPRGIILPTFMPETG